MALALLIASDGSTDLRPHCDHRVVKLVEPGELIPSKFRNAD